MAKNPNPIINRNLEWQYCQHLWKGLLVYNYTTITCFKNKGKNWMAEEQSHLQRVSLSNLIEKGLKDNMRHQLDKG